MLLNNNFFYFSLFIFLFFLFLCSIACPVSVSGQQVCYLSTLQNNTVSPLSTCPINYSCVLPYSAWSYRSLFFNRCALCHTVSKRQKQLTAEFRSDYLIQDETLATVCKSTLRDECEARYGDTPYFDVAEPGIALNASLFPIIPTCNKCNGGAWCGTGTQSPQDVALISNCPSGYYCPNPDAVLECPEGKFCPQGQRFPLECDTLGTYCAPGAIKATIPCAAGYFCPTPAQKILCPSGSYCPEASIYPFTCPSFSHCPAGTANPSIVWDGAIALVVIMASLVIFSFAIKYWRRRALRHHRELAEERVKEVELLKALEILSPSPLLDQKSQEIVMEKVKQIQVDEDFEEEVEYEPGMIMGSGGFKFPSRPGITLRFDNLCLEVPGSGGTPVRLLSGVSGQFQSGGLIAVMGPSGSGKTTFLNALYGRRPANSKFTGRMWVNGESVDPAIPLAHWPPLDGEVAYCMQDDVVQEALTVYENLYFSAEARLPRREKDKPHDPSKPFSYTSKQRLQLIERVMEILELEGVRDTLVGSPDSGNQTISGGQRKRCSVAVELVADARLLFLDEPTSALDSSVAFSLLNSLRQLTRESGLTVILSIHQPRYGIFRLFDQVLLLGKGGRTAYLGPPDLSVPYFKALGFPFPSEENPADFLLDLLAGEVQRPGDPNFEPSDLPIAWEKFQSLQNPREFLPFIQSSLDDIEETGGQGAAGNRRHIPPQLRQMPSLLSHLSLSTEENSPLRGLINGPPPKYRELINHSKPAQLHRLVSASNLMANPLNVLTQPNNRPSPPPLPPKGARASIVHHLTHNPLARAVAGVGEQMRAFTNFQIGIPSHRPLNHHANLQSYEDQAVEPDTLTQHSPIAPRNSEMLATIRPQRMSRIAINGFFDRVPSVLRQLSNSSGPGANRTAPARRDSASQGAGAPSGRPNLTMQGGIELGSIRPQLHHQATPSDQGGLANYYQAADEDDVRPGGSALQAMVQQAVHEARTFKPRESIKDSAASQAEEKVLETLNKLLTHSELAETPPFKPMTRTFPSFVLLFRLVLRREFLKLLRQYHHFSYDLIFLILSGLLLGALYSGSWSIGDYGSISTLASLCFGVLCSASALRRFSIDRRVFWRESSAGLPPWPYGLSVLLLDSIRLLLFPAVFLCVFYYLLQLRASFSRVFGLYCLVCWVGTGFGLSLSALLSPVPAFLAAVMLPLLLGFLSGVSPALADLSPAGLIACAFSYVRWAVEAMNIIELEAMPDHQEEQRKLIFTAVGWDRNGIGVDAGVLIAMGAALRIIALIALKYVDRDKKR